MRDNKLIRFLSRPTLLHYTMPVLIIYLITGTIVQKYIGLYEATQIFFSNPVLWLGGVPLPGFPILIALIFVNLLCHLIVKSKWSWASAGIILTHMGAMLLILGGLFTTLFSTEGYLDFAQGEVKSSYYDYHEREFVLLDDDGNTIITWAFDDIKTGQNHRVLDGRIQLDILNRCRNCAIRERTEFLEDLHYYGMAAHMAVSDNKPEMNNEENMAGIVFHLNYIEDEQSVTTTEPQLIATNPESAIADTAPLEQPTSPEDSILWDETAQTLATVPTPFEKPATQSSDIAANQNDDDAPIPSHMKAENAVHIVLEDVPQLPEIYLDGETYRLALRKKKRGLPFDIWLVKFDKEVYPGTEMAKGYQSRVRIQDGATLWEADIRMNEPLRYKGYSFYQSSFLRTADGGDISVLAVVWNAGRTFPYISSIAMCIGLILHLFLRRRYKIESDKDEKEEAKKEGKHA